MCVYKKKTKRKKRKTIVFNSIFPNTESSILSSNILLRLVKTFDPKTVWFIRHHYSVDKWKLNFSWSPVSAPYVDINSGLNPKEERKEESCHPQSSVLLPKSVCQLPRVLCTRLKCGFTRRVFWKHCWEQCDQKRQNEKTRTTWASSWLSVLLPSPALSSAIGAIGDVLRITVRDANGHRRRTCLGNIVAAYEPSPLHDSG